jgi:hypothetical protein
MQSSQKAFASHCPGKSCMVSLVVPLIRLTRKNKTCSSQRVGSELYVRTAWLEPPLAFCHPCRGCLDYALTIYD